MFVLKLSGIKFILNPAFKTGVSEQNNHLNFCRQEVNLNREFFFMYIVHFSI